MSEDDKTTRVVKSAELKENFELRDEIKQLRILIAAIIRGHGGCLYVFNRSLQNIDPRDTFTQEDDRMNDRIILTFEEN